MPEVMERKNHLRNTFLRTLVFWFGIILILVISILLHFFFGTMILGPLVSFPLTGTLMLLGWVPYVLFTLGEIWYLDPIYLTGMLFLESVLYFAMWFTWVLPSILTVLSWTEIA